ncbi:Nn.00g053020.m01.CDS01 [Neocucurbitaria sp. VM-36]
MSPPHHHGHCIVTTAVKVLQHRRDEDPTKKRKRHRTLPASNNAAFTILPSAFPTRPFLHAALNPHLLRHHNHHSMPPILSSLMSLLPKHPPTATISGLALTEPQAQTYLTTCRTLLHTLEKQQSDISRLPALPFHFFLKLLTSIQQRHSRIKDQLDLLLDCVKKSTQPWMKEFDDASEAMRRKIMKCNHASRPDRLGWREAAKAYWPLMCDTYAILSVLLVRLKGEVEDALSTASMWTTTGDWLSFGSSRTSQGGVLKANSKGKNIKFEKFVTVRRTFGDGIEENDGPVKYQEYSTRLTDDRKRTAGLCRSRTVHSTNVVLEREWDRVGDEGGSTKAFS